MRRSEQLRVTVYCPHFRRPVAATRNAAPSVDRLVDCEEKASCRDPDPPGAPGELRRPYPQGCPVFPSLAK